MSFNLWSLSRHNVTVNACMLERLRNDGAALGGQRQLGFLLYKFLYCQLGPCVGHVYTKTAGQNGSGVTRCCALLLFLVIEEPIKVRLMVRHECILRQKVSCIESFRSHLHIQTSKGNVDSFIRFILLHQCISASYRSHYPQSLASSCLLSRFPSCLATPFLLINTECMVRSHSCVTKTWEFAGSSSKKLKNNSTETPDQSEGFHHTWKDCSCVIFNQPYVINITSTWIRDKYMRACEQDLRLSLISMRWQELCSSVLGRS